MNETEKILSAIEKLRSEINGRLDEFEKRMSVCEQLGKISVKRYRKQQASIEELQKKVSELSKNDAIWRSRDQREVGIDRNAAYRAFNDLGYKPTDAMRLLEKAGLLRRDGEHLTRTVRTGDRTIRAVVIIEK